MFLVHGRGDAGARCATQDLFDVESLVGRMPHAGIARLGFAELDQVVFSAGLSGRRQEVVRIAHSDVTLRTIELETVALVNFLAKLCAMRTATRSTSKYRLGFAALLASRPSRQRDLVCAMVAERLIAPAHQAGDHASSASTTGRRPASCRQRIKK